MGEFAFELGLCARLEDADTLVARQLGAGVHRRGGRVVDILTIDPGPEFDERREITAETIPDLAIVADVGVGRARYYGDAFAELPVSREQARAVVDRAVDIGFFEINRRKGREYIRQATRYPDDWFGRLRAIENKPDLDSPGALMSQVRADVSLGLVDEVVLATTSYVTGAHLNRLPDEVGVWRVHDGDISVIREASSLPVEKPGIEILDEHAGRTDIRQATTQEIRRGRRQLAERAFGKGWRTYEFPACPNGAGIIVDESGTLPYCTYHECVVNSMAACGESCAGYAQASPPRVDLTAERDRNTLWDASPNGAATRQTELHQWDRRRE